jgi:hypothetical protein
MAIVPHAHPNGRALLARVGHVLRRLPAPVRRPLSWKRIIGVGAAVLLSGFLLWLVAFPGKPRAVDGNVAERFYLSDMKEVEVVTRTALHPDWEFTKNGTLPTRGTRLVVNDALSGHSLCFLTSPGAPCRVSYRLGKQYKLFKAQVAIDDNESEKDIELIFFVMADGQQRWRSKPVKKKRSNPPEECTLDMTGVDRLSLEVLDRGTHAGASAGVWFEPRLEK